MEMPSSDLKNMPSVGSFSEPTKARLRNTLASTGRIYLAPSEQDSALYSALAAFSENSEQEVLEWCSVVSEFTSSTGDVEKPSSNKTRSLFKYYFDRMGLTVSSSFTDAIMEGDVVEVFGTDGRRLFFNPELFDYSSYPPDVMFSTPFWRLYRRDPEVTELIQMHAVKVFSGQVTDPFKPEVPIHVVTETDSLHKYSSEVEIKLFAPVYLGRGIVGGAALERFRLLLS